MFQMFGFDGVKCPRCEHKNADKSGYCAQCGLTLGAAPNRPVLRENRWIAGAQELALFFGVRELSSMFARPLRVPPATRAFILQDDKVTEVPPGDYEAGRFFARLPELERSGHGEVLIARSAPLPVEFSFDDLHSAEHLQVAARFTVAVAIGQVAAFARHFMALPGSVTHEHLRELLAPSVRQLAAEFIASRTIRDMASNQELRLQLDERLQGALKIRLEQYGLAVSAVDTLALRHDKYDASRERIGTLWLVAGEREAKLEHARQLDQLYSAAEWQRIEREEQEGRQRHRRAELRQDESVERADLSLRNSERLHAIRAREIDLYSRIVDARTRKQAIEQGAGDVLVELEHELAKKGVAREDESLAWAHLRQLAQIRMRTELEIAQQEALEARQLAQQRFAHQLLQQQIENKIAQALGIEDESHKRAELARLRQSQAEAAGREHELEAERHKEAWQSLALANAARKREAERVQEWEDQLALERQRELLRADMLKDSGAKAEAEEINQKIEAMRRTGSQAEALAQHEKLLRTIEADAVHARNVQQIELEAQEKLHAMMQREHEAQWQQELRRLELAREEKFAQLAHGAELARIDIARAEAVGALDDTAKVALAAAPNAAALADLLKTQVHSAMSPEQLQALASVVGAANSVTPLDAARMAQERAGHERQLREAEVDKDRSHQLGLLKLQNDVNKAALGAQSQLGVGLAHGKSGSVPDFPTSGNRGQTPIVSGGARRACANGHVARPDDQFCAQCGAALEP